jgi:ABC-type dipeptide/oligopeptide/nickel transport system ATPase component
MSDTSPVLTATDVVVEYRGRPPLRAVDGVSRALAPGEVVALVGESGVSILLVTHDLGVMSAVADEVTVMRQGVVVEHAPRERLFTSPEHEYTRSLLAALPGSTLEESPDVLVDELLASPPEASDV